MVNGVIDAKFEGGYLVTMKVGSKVMKGVLYHGVKRPSQQPQQAMGTPPSGMALASQRRAKKKARGAAEVDSQKPKCHRSGYNFFFAEQYARLKPEYHGKERFITKMIGRMWGDLSESEKQVTHHQNQIHVVIKTKVFCLQFDFIIFLSGLSRQRS